MTARGDDADVALPAPAPASRPGRPRDEAKDEAILSAARELLRERGYAGMTMDAVAERAGAGKATVYRRWSSKVQLTVDSMLCAKQLTIDEVPDTGSLRDDLLAVATRASRLKNDDLMHGVMSAIREEPEVAAVFHEQFVASQARLMRDVLERAELRGETSPDADVEMITAVALAMVHYRKVVAHRPMDAAFAARLVDAVILPLATGRLTSAAEREAVAADA
ncbi:TetR/AcrR family transcriptional regulator [Cellulomonas sp. ES6]|uniref:TetR/AcrR family transcriptional regulator n=1 Tax=Cellulomonas sp. ES6 TaxID=3039384 RepID=UPI00198A8374|nr:TetR/AcrR family transcriptional regulator [Cellulomonas sp. ES6]MBD3780119.1 TetR/AcrR family transcriptional regulator [Micrococcales bacterium]WHP18312.1 TetR/AcrR family transcriptional regulator [Cellulomonas sp. ES6]